MDKERGKEKLKVDQCWEFGTVVFWRLYFWSGMGFINEYHKIGGNGIYRGC